MESILRSLGLEKEADMLLDNGDINSVRRALASHVGLEPRDTRLDRLLRLSLRLMPKGDDDDEQRYASFQALSHLPKNFRNGLEFGLEARHSGAVGSLLEDSLTLGEALIRIPGPGTALPLEADDYNLPAPDDVDSLSNEVNAKAQSNVSKFRWSTIIKSSNRLQIIHFVNAQIVFTRRLLVLPLAGAVLLVAAFPLEDAIAPLP